MEDKKLWWQFGKREHSLNLAQSGQSLTTKAERKYTLISQLLLFLTFTISTQSSTDYTKNAACLVSIHRGNAMASEGDRRL